MSLSLMQGFTKSLALTVLSEVGDNTFLAAAILAMRHPRRLVFSGCLAASIAMTICTVLLGWAAPNLLSRRWTHHITKFLYFGFGLWSLWEAYSEEEEDELAEMEEKLDADSKASSQASKGNCEVRKLVPPMYGLIHSRSSPGRWKIASTYNCSNL